MINQLFPQKLKFWIHTHLQIGENNLIWNYHHEFLKKNKVLLKQNYFFISPCQFEKELNNINKTYCHSCFEIFINSLLLYFYLFLGFFILFKCWGDYILVMIMYGEKSLKLRQEEVNRVNTMMMIFFYNNYFTFLFLPKSKVGLKY